MYALLRLRRPLSPLFPCCYNEACETLGLLSRRLLLGVFTRRSSSPVTSGVHLPIWYPRIYGRSFESDTVFMCRLDGASSKAP